MPVSTVSRRRYPSEWYLDLNAGEVDVDAATGTVTARALDKRGRAVLERTWSLEELRGAGTGGACAAHRGAPSRQDLVLGFGAVAGALLLGPLLAVSLVALLLARVAGLLGAAGRAVGNKREGPPTKAPPRTLSFLEKGKSTDPSPTALSEALWH